MLVHENAAAFETVERGEAGGEKSRGSYRLAHRLFDRGAVVGEESGDVARLDRVVAGSRADAAGSEVRGAMRAGEKFREYRAVFGQRFAPRRRDQRVRADGRGAASVSTPTPPGATMGWR